MERKENTGRVPSVFFCCESIWSFLREVVRKFAGLRFFDYCATRWFLFLNGFVRPLQQSFQCAVSRVKYFDVNKFFSLLTLACRFNRNSSFFFNSFQLDMHMLISFSLAPAFNGQLSFGNKYFTCGFYLQFIEAAICDICIKRNFLHHSHFYVCIFTVSCLNAEFLRERRFLKFMQYHLVFCMHQKKSVLAIVGTIDSHTPKQLLTLP